MKAFHTLTEKPEWVTAQERLGATVICNAPRPLYGNATNDDWSMPFVHGRHYAALDPNYPEFEAWMKRNEELDACQLRFVTQQEAVEAGLKYYEAEYPQYLERIRMDDPRHLDMLAKRGVDVLNGFD